ncbi:hypothetical protein JB92DRAFT_2272739 [Gautieria morchelliformis]|nr:hypothetical protein JB92DRAFT_2272739 [Gautieria morchelliformis]
MPAWETYYQELISRGHGHAVWDPDPGEEPAVQVADVGYMKNGTFIRLFNASKAIGDISNKLGTPEGYEPIYLGEMKHGTLSAAEPITSETVLHRRGGVSVSGGSMVQSGGGFTFECTKEQGAALILRQDARRTDALRKTNFTRYVLENHSKWLKFANDVHERGISADQLLMVTGCDKTSQWACAAFLASSNQIGVEFRVGNVGVAQGGVSVWGSWNHCQFVEAHSGPSSRVRQTPSSNSQQITYNPRTNSRNQCVFLRGYKLCDRLTMERRMQLSCQKKPLDDGFTHLPHQRKGDDENKPGGSSGSSNNDSYGSSGIWVNAIDQDGGIADDGLASESCPNNGSQDSLGSSIQSQTDSYSFIDIEQSDDDLSLYQCQETPELTHLDILMQYIFENSYADRALVHHDDLLTMLEDLTPTSDFEGVLHQVQPRIFVNNGVGMLKSTYIASRYAEYSKLKTINLNYKQGDLVNTSFPKNLEEDINNPPADVSITQAISHNDRRIVPRIAMTSVPEKGKTTAIAKVAPHKLEMRIDEGDERARFNERQKDHYAKLLREKWGCPLEGHTVCVLTRDGQHFRLAGVDIDQWVNALVSNCHTIISKWS